MADLRPILEALAAVAFGVVVVLGMVAMIVAAVAPTMQRLTGDRDEPRLPRKPRVEKGGGR